MDLWYTPYVIRSWYLQMNNKGNLESLQLLNSLSAQFAQDQCSTVRFLVFSPQTAIFLFSLM